MGYSPWGCKELDTTEQLHFPFLSPQYSHTVRSGGGGLNVNLGDRVQAIALLCPHSCDSASHTQSPPSLASALLALSLGLTQPPGWQ